MAHINCLIPATLDPLQFAYRPNRSIDDAISIALHTALSNLDKRNTYVRMLLIDYSSVFNTIVHTKLVTKLRTLGLNTSLCNWILDILTGRPQVVRVGNITSAMLTINTGAPQGCVLSSLLYSLFNNSNTIIKFADNTTVVGLNRVYSCTIESILTGCITAWYGNSTALDHMALQRVVRTAQYISGAKLSTIQDLYQAV